MAVHIGSMFFPMHSFREYEKCGFLGRKRFCFAFSSRGGDRAKDLGGVENQTNQPTHKHLVKPRKRWLCPDMTEKLLTGTLSLNTYKQTNQKVNVISGKTDGQ